MIMIFNICIHLMAFQSLLVISNASAENDTAGVFRIKPEKLQTRLEGFVFRTFDKISPRRCFNKCTQRPMCHSFNYNIVHLKCELNSKPLSGVDRDFHNDDSCVYVEVDRYQLDPSYDTCIENRCKEGEVRERPKNGRLFCVKDSCENYKVTNVAYGKSTQADDEHSGHPSSNAVDDDNNTYVHTNTRDSPYWLVDLGDSHVIEKIDLLNTNFEGYRLHDLDISVGNAMYNMTVCAHYDGPGTDGEHLVFNVEGKAFGRYVKLNIVGTGQLQFAEVKVFGYLKEATVC